MFSSTSTETTEEPPPAQPSVIPVAAPTVIQPATATTDSLIGDLLSLDLPSAAPPTQYNQAGTGKDIVCCHIIVHQKLFVVSFVIFVVQILSFTFSVPCCWFILNLF